MTVRCTWSGPWRISSRSNSMASSPIRYPGRLTVDTGMLLSEAKWLSS